MGAKRLSKLVTYLKRVYTCHSKLEVGPFLARNAFGLGPMVSSSKNHTADESNELGASLLNCLIDPPMLANAQETLDAWGSQRSVSFCPENHLAQNPRLERCPPNSMKPDRGFLCTIFLNGSSRDHRGQDTPEAMAQEMNPSQAPLLGSVFLGGSKWFGTGHGPCKP